MSAEMIDALVQLGLAWLVGFWWMRAGYWRRKYEKAKELE